MTPGLVTLVGAGPGHPDFLTCKGLRRLQEADVVLHDALVSDEVLALAPHAQHVPVGKRGRGVHTAQDTINALLIQSARHGLRVVRLKGGDAFVFGRGGEEALALQAAGIPFEIVPGVSSALAAPALAGIPVTHRGTSPGVVVISGNEAAVMARTLSSIVPGALTLVVLMAVASRGELTAQLRERGWPPATPAALIAAAATARMWTWRGSLDTLAAVVVPAAVVDAPATIVIGDVVDLPIALVNGMLATHPSLVGVTHVRA